MVNEIWVTLVNIFVSVRIFLLKRTNYLDWRRQQHCFQSYCRLFLPTEIYFFIIALDDIAMDETGLDENARDDIALDDIALNETGLNTIAWLRLHWMRQHWIRLDWMRLHNTRLHWTTLHYCRWDCTGWGCTALVELEVDETAEDQTWNLPSRRQAT